MADTQDKLYTLQEVADYLRVTRQTIYNYVAAKKLKAFKAGREYRVTEEELQAFIKSTYNTNK